MDPLTFLTYLPVVLTASDAGTIDGLLELATKLVTWLITSATSWLGFVTENPIVLVAFMLTLAGAGIGFLIRIWKSA